MAVRDPSTDTMSEGVVGGIKEELSMLYDRKRLLHKQTSVIRVSLSHTVAGPGGVKGAPVPPKFRMTYFFLSHSRVVGVSQWLAPLTPPRKFCIRHCHMPQNGQKQDVCPCIGGGYVLFLTWRLISFCLSFFLL